MPSTFSPLKIELIATGEQSGTWGTTTNTNLGTALEEAITGSADVAFSSADVTVTLTDTNAAQTARNLRLNLTGTSGGARNLILGSGCQIEKLYLINNGLADAVTVKNTSGTGIAVPAGKTMFVYNNGTNVVEAVNSAVTLDATTIDTTNLEVTNLKAKDGTSAGSIANSTGVVTLASSVLTTTDINGGTIDNTAIGGSTAAAGKFTTLEATGVATFSAGTLSLPSITTTGDTNTGIFFPVADTIAFTEGGVESMRINASGDVGIGTSSPATKAEISGTAASANIALRITNTDASGYSTLQMGDGNAGIYRNGSSQSGYAGTSSLNLITVGAHNIGFSTQNTLRAIIDSSGNLCVGSTAAGNAGAINVSVGLAGTTSGGIQLFSSTSANHYVQFGDGATGANAYRGYVGYEHGTDAMAFATSSTERMRIDSSGNVGIGVTSVGARLDISAAVGTMRITSSTGTNGVNLRVNNTGGDFYFGRENSTGGAFGVTAYSSLLWSEGAYPMVFATNNAERMRIDSSGNVGIGVTPNTWGSGYKAIQLTDGVVFCEGGGNTYIANNWFNDGTNKYIATGAGAIYEQSGGVHAWYTAASGTGGTAVTFSERMRIDSSGNVLVGTTDSGSTTGVGTKQIANATVPYFINVVNDSTGSNYYLLYNTNATNNGYRFYVQANGGVANFSGNNTNLSDERTKENIELSSSYLDKICAIPVKTFNYKDEPAGEQKTLGVIAQDVEAVAPEFVNNAGFGETKESETPLKSVYTTDLMFALMKSIQELKAELDSVKAELQTLKGN